MSWAKPPSSVSRTKPVLVLSSRPAGNSSRRGVGVPHQIDDGGVPLVGGGADDALGLIEHEVDELLVIKRPAVHCHGVGGLQLGVPFLADRTVHGDAPFCQQRLGLAPGALGRLGQIFVESHGVLLILNVSCGYIVAF